MTGWTWDEAVAVLVVGWLLVLALGAWATWREAR